MKVPFLDLKKQYESIAGEIDGAIHQVIGSCAFSGGPYVAEFEEKFAAFCGKKHAIGVGSGTEALWMALLSLGVGPGDEVITAPNSFIATAEAITFCGAAPVFVDVDEQTQTLDPALLEQAITAKTRAVIPVHLYGRPARMDEIMAIARRHSLLVVEDACQAHGARHGGLMAGTMGDAGCFSFYPGKNLGAYGEAGGIVTDDDTLADTLRMLREHGQIKKYVHLIPGWNGRMDGIQGAILTAKLSHLPRWNEARRRHAALYSSLLSGIEEIRLPDDDPRDTPVYHLYTIRTSRRDELLQALADKGISCGIHYPVPIHLQEAYRQLNLRRGSFPVAERCADETLSLPMFPELTREQIEYVAAEIVEWFVHIPETRTAAPSAERHAGK